MTGYSLSRHVRWRIASSQPPGLLSRLATPTWGVCETSRNNAQTRRHGHAARTIAVDGRIYTRSGLTTGVLRHTGTVSYYRLFDCGEALKRKGRDKQSGQAWRCACLPVWLDQAPLWRSLVTSDKNRFAMLAIPHTASLMLGISFDGTISVAPKHSVVMLLLG